MKKEKIGAAAVVFALAVPVFSVGCSDSTDNDNIDNNNNNIDFGEITEYTQTTENVSDDLPEEPVIGGDYILSQDTKGDLTATLNILNISQLPDGSEENNYYCGEYLMVRIKDNKSGITVGNTLPENMYILFGEDYVIDGKKRISADIAANSIELLGIENNGETEYVLKVEYIRGSGDRRLAAFASCDMSGYGEMGGLLKWYSFDEGYYSFDNECLITPSFTYEGGSKFSDSRLELVYEFDTEGLQVAVREMNPSDIVFGEPEIGKNSILSRCTLGEYSAAVEIHDIIRLPKDGSDPKFGALYSGSKLFLSLSVGDEALAYGTINDLVGGGGWHESRSIQEKCTGEGTTRIFRTEQNGETHYIVMQYSVYDKEKDMIGARFACYNVYDEYKDRFGEIEYLPILWFEIRRLGVKTFGFSTNEIQVSDAFEYVGEGVFRDSVYGYEIRFDCENLEAEARRLAVEG